MKKGTWVKFVWAAREQAKASSRAAEKKFNLVSRFFTPLRCSRDSYPSACRAALLVSSKTFSSKPPSDWWDDKKKDLKLSSTKRIWAEWRRFADCYHINASPQRTVHGNEPSVLCFCPLNGWRQMAFLIQTFNDDFWLLLFQRDWRIKLLERKTFIGRRTKNNLLMNRELNEEKFPAMIFCQFQFCLGIYRSFQSTLSEVSSFLVNETSTSCREGIFKSLELNLISDSPIGDFLCHARKKILTNFTRSRKICSAWFESFLQFKLKIHFLFLKHTFCSHILLPLLSLLLTGNQRRLEPRERQYCVSSFNEFTVNFAICINSISSGRECAIE